LGPEWNATKTGLSGGKKAEEKTQKPFDQGRGKGKISREEGVWKESSNLVLVRPTKTTFLKQTRREKKKGKGEKKKRALKKKERPRATN